jgi:transcriptional regulator with XRE-family HTH domain
MKQAQFAAKIGITQSYPSALERGLKEPGASVLVAISREFGRSVDWPLTGKSPTEPTTYSIVAALSDAGNTIATPITVTPSAPGLLNNETRFFEFVRGF